MVFENFMLFMNKIMLFSSYVNNASGFPKPLTPEEEKMYFEKFKNGDTKAKEILINHNLRLVAHIVKKYSGAGEADDLISVGSIGLIKAINSFKADKNIKIATYASKCIENEILMHLRKISKIKQEVSLNEPLKTDGDGNELMLCDVVPSDDVTPETNLNNNVEVKILWQIINKLNMREREIMVLRFGLNGGEEQTQKEVALKLNISQSYISRLEKKIVNRIKKEMLKIS